MKARAFFVGIAFAASAAFAQQVELNPGYIAGTVDIPGFTVTTRQVYANGANGAQSNVTLSGGGSYSLTVNVPAGPSTSFGVYAYAYTNSNNNYLRYPTQTVAVTQGATTTVDFSAIPAIVNAAVNVSGGTLNYAYVYASRNDGAFAQAYAPTSTTQFAAPAGASISLYGTAYLTNGAQISLPTQTLALTQGASTNVVWNVSAPSAGGGIAGTYAIQGASPIYIYMYASGPVFQQLTLSGNGPFSFSNLPAGNYYIYTYAYFDNYQTYLGMPNAGFDPTRNPAVGNGVTTVNIGTSIANIAGQVTLTGSKSIAQASGAQINIQGYGQGASTGGFGYAQVSLPNGTFLARASAGDWWLSSLNVSFYDPSPSSFLNANFQIQDYSLQSQPTTAVAGQTVTRNLSYAVGTLALTLRTGNSTTFSNPYLNALCYRRDANNQVIWQYWAYSYGNQQNVSEAQLTLVGPEGSCTVTAYGYINGGSTQFGQVTVNIVPGSNQIIDIGGPSLTVTAPAADYVTSNSTIAVTGTATDDVSVASVSVNNLAATLSPGAGVASVSFAATVPLTPGANQIATIATDGSGKQGTDTRTVYRDAGPPTLVVTTPADGTVTLDSTITITGTATDDVEVKSITLNGTAISFTTGGNPSDPREVAFTVTAGLQNGDNFLTITAKDETPSQSASKTVKVTKTTMQNQAITFAALPDKNYGDAAITLGATASSGLAVTYATSGQCSVVGATLSLTGAGNCSVTASQAGNAQYNAAPDVTRNFAIGKASPAITWANPADIVYGAALGGSQLNATASGVGGGSIAGSFTYSPVSGTVLNAGPAQTLSVTFTPADTANYASSNKSVAINVGKATPTLTWANPADISYGTGLGASQLNATASGVSGSLAGTFVYTPAAGTVLGAGPSQTLSVTFTPSDTTNYTSPVIATAVINVGKATPTVAWSNPADIVYGNALGATQLNATATGTGGSSLPGTFTYTPASGTVLNAGPSQTLSVSFTPSDTANYASPVSKTVSINVTKATPVVAWSTPTDIVYGTALGATQLNATATGVSGALAGTFTYTPPSGTVLNAGPNQALSVSFVPGDTANYSSPVSKSVTINVSKAAQAQVSVSAPASATYAQAGVAASASGGSGTGAYSYSAAGSSACTIDATSGAITITSGTGTCSITATRAGDGNYNASSPSAAASIAIGKATTATTVTVSDATYDANSHGGSAGVSGIGLNQALTVTYAGTGSTSYGPTTTPPTNAGTYSASASFAATANYLASSDVKTFTIFKASSQVTVVGTVADYDGNPHAATSATVSGVGTGIMQTVSWTYAPPGNATLPVNAGTYTATASYAGDANHLGSSGSASVVINAVPAAIVYTGLEAWSTSSATSTTATVTSSATVTASAGNVTTARVTFTNDQYPSGIPGCVSLAVGAATGLTGSVACQWTASVPSSGNNAGFLNTTVTAVLLPGNYLTSSDSDTINVTQPNQQNFITGGGYLKLTASSGQYAGDGGTKSNFGFNVKYNKSGSNLQGNLNILVRKGTTVYQFKGNAMNSLTVNVPNATFTGKANLQAWDIANPAAVSSIAGNLTIQLQAQDVAEPGAGKDKLAITVWDSSGALLYSSAWIGSTTALQVITGGNLQVR